MTESAEAKTGERTAALLEDDDLKTLLTIASNGQSGRIAQYEVRELVRVYRAFPALVEALRAIIACDAECQAFGTFGMADSADNNGNPYQSQHLADVLANARSALEAALKTEGR